MYSHCRKDAPFPFSTEMQSLSVWFKSGTGCQRLVKPMKWAPLAPTREKYPLPKGDKAETLEARPYPSPSLGSDVVGSFPVRHFRCGVARPSAGSIRDASVTRTDTEHRTRSPVASVKRSQRAKIHKIHDHSWDGRARAGEVDLYDDLRGQSDLCDNNCG